MSSVFKFLLLPFSWLFGFVTLIRNKAYDRKLFKSYHSPLNTIVVGNLQVGGAGKTPMTAYLFHLFGGGSDIAILSRGYGRKSKGLLFANEQSHPNDIGDEPYWYHNVLKAPKVVVSESRSAGLKFLEKANVKNVILDDAYQHRAIQADVYLLLSEYALPYYKDYPLPYGRLREYRTGDKRADFIIFTKCPPDLNIEKKIAMIGKCNPADHQQVFFTTLKYGSLNPVKGNRQIVKGDYKRILAVSGIASTTSFLDHCKGLSPVVVDKSFGDHHDYKESDILAINGALDKDTIVVCTEKDMVKFQSEWLHLIPENKYYSLPVETVFLFHEDQKFAHALSKCLKEKHTAGKVLPE